MNEDDVRARAEAFGEALIAGNVDAAVACFSDELRRNLGEVIALLPLPAAAVNIESVERTGSGFAVVLETIGETVDVRLQTRWKDRDGTPTIVEVSHLSQAEREPATDVEGAAIGEVSEETLAAIPD
jgi:hypothetical protein